MLAGLICLVSFGQHVFLQFYSETIILLKFANLQVRLFEVFYHQKVHKKLHIGHYLGYPGFSSGF